MPLENGFREQTREDSNKTHLSGEDSNKAQLAGGSRWLYGNARGAGSPGPKECGFGHSDPAGRPSANSQGGTATTLPSSAPRTRAVLELSEPRSSSARGPGPPGAFGLVVCAQSSPGTHLDRHGRCRNKTNPLTLQCSLIMAQTGLCVPGHRGTESEGHTSSGQHSPGSRGSEQDPGGGQAHGTGILALSISSCEILCETPSSVCSGETPRPQSHPSPLHRCCWRPAPVSLL